MEKSCFLPILQAEIDTLCASQRGKIFFCAKTRMQSLQKSTVAVPKCNVMVAGIPYASKRERKKPSDVSKEELLFTPRLRCFVACCYSHPGKLRNRAQTLFRGTGVLLIPRAKIRCSSSRERGCNGVSGEF